MNLLIFTPAIKTSAIARMAALVSRALVSSGHQVTIVRTESHSLLTTDTQHFAANLVAWTDQRMVDKLIKSSDACIYQIGNNYSFHEGAIEWLTIKSGLVCLHDFFVGHLFSDWGSSRSIQMKQILNRWYSNDDITKFLSFFSEQSHMDDILSLCPMIEWIGSMASDVITHSHYGLPRLLSSCSGLVTVIPMAYDAMKPSPNLSIEKKSDNHSFRLLTLGNINWNKRADSVIRAIGSSALLRESIIYELIGSIDVKMKYILTNLANTLGVNLIISGECDDETFSKSIINSDLVSCLRRPTLEAASASAIEAMLHGKPIIVTDAGFYSELPDECVFKLSIDNEEQDLRLILEALLNDEPRRKAVGAKAQQWAEKTFCAEQYATKLIDFIKKSLQAKQIVSSTNYFVTLLNSWSASPEMFANKDIIEPLRVFE